MSARQQRTNPQTEVITGDEQLVLSSVSLSLVFFFFPANLKRLHWALYLKWDEKQFRENLPVGAVWLNNYLFISFSKPLALEVKQRCWVCECVFPGPINTLQLRPIVLKRSCYATRLPIYRVAFKQRSWVQHMSAAHLWLKLIKVANDYFLLEVFSLLTTVDLSLFICGICCALFIHV